MQGGTKEELKQGGAKREGSREKRELAPPPPNNPCDPREARSLASCWLAPPSPEVVRVMRDYSR